MSDEADLEEEAKFGIVSFLDAKGVKLILLADPNAKNLPNIIVQNSLKEDFLVPTPQPMERTGEVMIKVNSPIKILNFEQ